MHFHCYTGPSWFVEAWQAAGYRIFVLGVTNLAVMGGLPTSTRMVVYHEGRDRVVLESDSPYFSLDGGANTPQSVYRVAEHLAVKWGTSVGNVMERTTAAFELLYRISH